MAGAPKGNTNALRHGLSYGQLPKGAAYIARITAKFSQFVSDAVVEAGGMLDIPTMARIQSAVRWERHALLSQRWLRREHDALSPSDRLAFSREIARASSERDKCLERLGLGARESGSILDAIYAPHTPNLEDPGVKDVGEKVPSPVQPAGHLIRRQ